MNYQCRNSKISENQTAGVINWQRCENDSVYLVDYWENRHNAIMKSLPICKTCYEDIRDDEEFVPLQLEIVQKK